MISSSQTATTEALNHHPDYLCTHKNQRKPHYILSFLSFFVVGLGIANEKR